MSQFKLTNLMMFLLYHLKEPICKFNLMIFKNKLFFNDGSKMFIIDMETNKVYEFNLK